MHKQTVLRWNNLSVTFCVDCTTDRTPFRVNWGLYALCSGENINDKLVLPVNCTRTDSGSGHITLAVYLPKFADAGQLPIQVPLSHLDEGKGIEETPRSHKAPWHKSCFNKCRNAKLTSAQKRRHTKVNLDSDEGKSTQSSPIKTRHASLETAVKFLTSDDIKQCFFCEQEGRKIRMITVKPGLGSSDTTVS